MLVCCQLDSWEQTSVKFKSEYTLFLEETHFVSHFLSPGRRQDIIWTNGRILLIGPLGTNFSEILIEIQTFHSRKMHLKMSSVKWRPFCLGLNVSTRRSTRPILYSTHSLSSAIYTPSCIAQLLLRPWGIILGSWMRHSYLGGMMRCFLWTLHSWLLTQCCVYMGILFMVSDYFNNWALTDEYLFHMLSVHVTPAYSARYVGITNCNKENDLCQHHKNALTHPRPPLQSP